MYQAFQCAFRGGDRSPNHFLMGSKMKSWIIHVKMRVPETIGSDVPNFGTLGTSFTKFGTPFIMYQIFFKNVPNFVKDVPNFVKDLPMLPKFVMRWGTTFNNLPMVSKEKNGLWKWR